MADERIAGRESVANVACVQMSPAIGEKEHNVTRSVTALRRVAASGSRLIVLPELCTTGYVFNTRAEMWPLAEPVPEGPTCQAWAAVARDLDVYIVAGLAERDGPRLYNTAVLIGPEGHLGTYRKAHLWHEEKLFFEPGDLGFPVYPTALGRVAMLICYDSSFPEAYRLCALQGADIVCVPANWSRKATPPGEKPMEIYIVMTSARLNGVFVAVADRVGIERGKAFNGHSVIVGPTGWPIAGPAGADEEAILMAECNLMDARRAKRLGDLNARFQDRRTDLYDVMLGSRHRSFAF